MANIVTASIIFSFKGKTFTPSVTLDLDKYLVANAKLPDLYHIIAAQNGFDHYSYEFEMMEAEPIKFSDAQGLVADFIKDGNLDLVGFEKAWQEQQLVESLQDLAKRHMDIKNLEEKPELKRTLIEAYQLGLKRRN